MRRRYIALAVAFIAGLGFLASMPADDAAPAAPSKADMDALVKLLDGNAAAWLAGNPVDAKADDRLKALAYDGASLALLSAALETQRSDPANLYVANKLIAPLLTAKPETILAAIPAIRKFEASAGDYKPFPRLDYNELKALQPPAGADDDAAKARKLRDDKVARERLILLHNQQLAAFQLTLAKLMFLANDRAMDQALVAYLAKFVREGVQVYVDILDYIKSQAVVMEKERARFFFDALAALGKDNLLAKKPLTDPAGAKIQSDSNTAVPSRTDYVGIRLIEAADIFASLAEQEVIKPPMQEEVDAAGKPAPTSAPAPTPKATPVVTPTPAPPTPGPRPSGRPPRPPRPRPPRGG
ncbi:MAG: hypothetical protein ACE15C_10360 [Phycisphaerae bacterium]